MRRIPPNFEAVFICGTAIKIGQLRTVQRHVKAWWSEAAHKLVFGTGTAASIPAVTVVAG